MKFVLSFVIAAFLQLGLSQQASAQLFEFAQDGTAVLVPIETESGEELYAMPVSIVRDETGEIVKVVAASQTVIVDLPADIAWTAGLHLGAPTLASVSAGVIVGSVESQFDLSLGALIELEAGIGGAAASLGLAGYFGAVLGGSIKGTVLRTWGKPIGLGGHDPEPGNTYLGASLTGGLLAKITFGVMKRVGGTTGSDMIFVFNTGLAGAKPWLW